jgi:hypothetical protein
MDNKRSNNSVSILYKPYLFVPKYLLLKRKIVQHKIDYIPIKYHTHNSYHNLVIQTPILFIPFNISNFDMPNNYLDVSFNNNQYDKDIELFYQFVTHINTYFNKLKKFKKYRFVSSVKPKYNNYPERLRLNYNKKLSVSVFNEEKTKIDISYLKSKMYGKFLIQISNIWLNKETSQYGIIWNISQIKLYSNLIYSPYDYSFHEENTNDFVSETNPKYKQYFFMLKIGLGKEAVKHKLKKDNIDTKIIELILGSPRGQQTPGTPGTVKFSTLKKNNNPLLNIFSDIKKGITLKKVSIDTDNKPKRMLSHNNLVPSEDDIISALNKLKKCNTHIE